MLLRLTTGFALGELMKRPALCLLSCLALGACDRAAPPAGKEAAAPGKAAVVTGMERVGQPAGPDKVVDDELKKELQSLAIGEADYLEVVKRLENAGYSEAPFHVLANHFSVAKYHPEVVSGNKSQVSVVTEASMVSVETMKQEEEQEEAWKRTVARDDVEQWKSGNFSKGSPVFAYLATGDAGFLEQLPRPWIPSALAVYARTMSAGKDQAQITGILKTAVQQNPGDAWYALQLAEHLRKNGHSTEARRWVEEAMASHKFSDPYEEFKTAAWNYLAKTFPGEPGRVEAMTLETNIEITATASISGWLAGFSNLLEESENHTAAGNPMEAQKSLAAALRLAMLKDRSNSTVQRHFCLRMQQRLMSDYSGQLDPASPSMPLVDWINEIHSEKWELAKVVGYQNEIVDQFRSGKDTHPLNEFVALLPELGEYEALKRLAGLK
jgi:hypothetical protein